MTGTSYAGDTKLSQAINNLDDVARLQRDLNAIYKWGEVGNLQFNAGKVQALPYQLTNALMHNFIITLPRWQQCADNLEE